MDFSVMSRVNLNWCRDESIIMMKSKPTIREEDLCRSTVWYVDEDLDRWWPHHMMIFHWHVPLKYANFMSSYSVDGCIVKGYVLQSFYLFTITCQPASWACGLRGACWGHLHPSRSCPLRAPSHCLLSGGNVGVRLWDKQFKIENRIWNMKERKGMTEWLWEEGLFTWCTLCCGLPTKSDFGGGCRWPCRPCRSPSAPSLGISFAHVSLGRRKRKGWCINYISHKWGITRKRILLTIISSPSERSRRTERSLFDHPLTAHDENAILKFVVCSFPDHVNHGAGTMHTFKRPSNNKYHANHSAHTAQQYASHERHKEVKWQSEEVK